MFSKLNKMEISTEVLSNAPRPARQVTVNTGVDPVLAHLIHPIHHDPPLPVEVCHVAHGICLKLFKGFYGIPDGKELGDLELVGIAESSVLVWVCREQSLLQVLLCEAVVSC